MDPPNKKRRLAPKTDASPAPAALNPPNAPAIVGAPLPARVEFERFARHLQDAAMLIQRSAERPPYASVSVLLLRWEEDTTVESDLDSLEKVFRDQYHYRTERWNIPTVANPSIKLGVQMASFLESARSDHLLIIYYAGHGYVGADNQLYWASNTRDDAARLKWHGVRCLFEDAQSDILLFLDTCSIRDAPLTGSHGLKQAIAAWGPEQKGRDPRERTFTSILVECLQKLGDLKNSFTVQTLYDAIQAQREAEVVSLTNGSSKPHHSSQIPIYFTITPGRGQSITLAQSLPAAISPINSQLPSPRQATDSTEAEQPKSQDQTISPQAVHDLLFDQSRVLACTTFVGEASPDMAYFNKWLEDTPAIADKVAVEAMFFGPPTMLLISMSLSIWEVVKHDKVCIFLGYIGSHNFVHLYQRLIGFSGSRLPGRAAKEVEHGRILLEAREAASGAKRSRQDTETGDSVYRSQVDRESIMIDGTPTTARSQLSPYSTGRYAPGSGVKDEVEDSAEMKAAAEQLKALSHTRHPNATPTKPQRSSLPDSAPDRQADAGANGAGEGNGLDGHGAEYSTPNKKHSRRSIPKQTPKHETRCGHCSHAPFKDSSSLRKHIAAAHTRPFPCAFSFAGCESTFGSKNEWKRHITSQHLCLQYYRCSACPTSTSEGKYNEFNRKDLFTQHLRRMHAPFAIKKSLSMVDSKTQVEWEGRVKEMQQSCLVRRRHPPQLSACPKPDCQSVFEGPGSWDEWTEHVGRHMEKNEGQRLGVDRHLAKWALEEGIIERDEKGEYKLVQESFAGGRAQDQSKDSISVSHPDGLVRDTSVAVESSEINSGGDAGGANVVESVVKVASNGAEGDKMDIDDR
ncbi:hypothetical protein jhhlp_006094 [Lomentospora prolificans]|uniref:C2H2-type domain-containing protein n=1 Tax=Lomentospora prolificans TaxID=41688 RepID=A0A2N3N4X0_9PEZI|nr:hypothetical protein jhhlp_006094 [Lomentospora prolificans]